MKLEQAKVLITGAAGGIGAAMAGELRARGARVLLVDMNERALAAVREKIDPSGTGTESCVANLTEPADRLRLVEVARRWGVNVLVNNAGINRFGLLQDQSEADVQASLRVNVEAPMMLTQALIPHLAGLDRAVIVNMGSVFGGIGYPGYVAYSACKFAMHGFTEALRRELSDTRIAVRYLAPRATRTPINPANVEAMNAALGVAMDPPAVVAQALCAMISGGRRERVVGWPEKLFVRINALFPALVDQSVNKQLPVIKRFARGEHAQNVAAPARPVTP